MFLSLNVQRFDEFISALGIGQITYRAPARVVRLTDSRPEPNLRPMAIFLTDSNRTDSLTGVADILAVGLVRVLARKSSQNFQAEAKTPLDCRPPSGGHVPQQRKDITP